MTVADFLALFDAPEAPLIVGAAAAMMAAFALIWSLVGAWRRSAALRDLRVAQERIAGGLTQAADASARAQAETVRLMEARLDALGERLGTNLAGASGATERALGALGERLEAIDRAQANIERLSGDVLSLQDILSNKQARGAFGELQLADIVTAALPRDVVDLQATLSNGRRVDALIKLPEPPGPVAVDAKFPLEPYEALVAAGRGPNRPAAERAFRQAVRAHVAAIAERYLVPGETAEGAILFLPSEAVYAELHGRFPDLVREGFAKRVWIVSPTTLMATLHTVRAVLRDAKLQEETGALRREVGRMAQDVERVAARVGRLREHFSAAERDVAEIDAGARAALARMRRIDGRDPDSAEAAE